MNKRLFFWIFIFLLLNLALFSQVNYNTADVYIYPHELVPGDLLTDGNYSTADAIKINDTSLLIWVDHFPGFRFSHHTTYILISKKDGIRKIDGLFWPVLNGKQILLNNKVKYTASSPFTIYSLLEDMPAAGKYETKSLYNYINVHFLPEELTKKDKLTDGPKEKLLRLENNTFFIWIDLMPGAKFVHPTLYLFISKGQVWYEKGEWWPELNGKRILYGNRNDLGIISPFIVHRK